MEQFNRYFIDTLKNRYAKFGGRATRSEYWYFVLFHFIIIVLATLIDTYVLNPLLGMDGAQSAQGGILQVIVALALFIPLIAVGIRRLHDIGKIGWWYLLALIPIVGMLVLLYFFVQDSQPGENLYGANPKGL